MSSGYNTPRSLVLFPSLPMFARCTIKMIAFFVPLPIVTPSVALPLPLWQHPFPLLPTSLHSPPPETHPQQHFSQLPLLLHSFIHVHFIRKQSHFSKETYPGSLPFAHTFHIKEKLISLHIKLRTRFLACEYKHTSLSKLVHNSYILFNHLDLFFPVWSDKFKNFYFNHLECLS